MQYKNNPDQHTQSEINKTLAFIRQHSNGLMEKAGDSKWTTGNRVFCYAQDGPGIYVYMVGALKNGKVSWHMMPMYGVAEMKDKWSDALSPFVSGKSCIQYKSFDELPTDAITDIVSRGGELFKQVMQEYRTKKKR